jgi:hypothetical protein
MILPDPSPETRPFWAAAAEHRLMLRHCARCDRWLHPQFTFCPCGAPSLDWRESSGDAVLVSHSIVRWVPVPAFRDELPFTLLLVRLREGPQLVSSLPGEGHALRCGMPMRATFTNIDPEIALVRFVPTEVV